MKGYDIIKGPVISDKSMKNVKDKVYTFEVDKKFNKVEIRKAIEEIYGVQVERVNTISVKGKTKVKNTKAGKVESKAHGYKKAIVTLKKGSKSIAFFESLSQ